MRLPGRPVYLNAVELADKGPAVLGLRMSKVLLNFLWMFGKLKWYLIKFMFSFGIDSEIGPSENFTPLVPLIVR